MKKDDKLDDFKEWTAERIRKLEERIAALEQKTEMMNHVRNV